MPRHEEFLVLPFNETLVLAGNPVQDSLKVLVRILYFEIFIFPGKALIIKVYLNPDIEN